MDATDNYQHQVPPEPIGPEPFDWKPYKWFLYIFFGTLGTLIIFGIGLVIYQDSSLGYMQNIYATGVGTVLTIAVLDTLARRREELREKEALIRQMGSRSNAFAVEAARLLKLKGLLTDGTLRGENFSEADLAGADLKGAQLQRANFEIANFQQADLSMANLQQAGLQRANLQQAGLRQANLQQAYLQLANFQHANLETADLQQAILWGANFQQASLSMANLQQATLNGANLHQADLRWAHLDGAYLENATLPDGSQYVESRDMREFTDPKRWEAETGRKAWKPKTQD